MNHYLNHTAEGGRHLSRCPSAITHKLDVAENVGHDRSFWFHVGKADAIMEIRDVADRISWPVAGIVVFPFVSEWDLESLIEEAWSALLSWFEAVDENEDSPDWAIIGFGHGATLMELVYTRKYAEFRQNPRCRHITLLMSFSPVLFAHRIDIHRFRYAHTKADEPTLPNNGCVTTDKRILTISGNSNPATFWGSIPQPLPLVIFTGTLDAVAPMHLAFDHYRFAPGSTLWVEVGASHRLSSFRSLSELGHFSRSLTRGHKQSGIFSDLIHLFDQQRRCRSFSRTAMVNSLNLDFKGWTDPMAHATPHLRCEQIRCEGVGHELSALIYLPPGYHESQQRFPVIYVCYNPGFTPNSRGYLGGYWERLIRSGTIPPMIGVIWNQDSAGWGSGRPETSLPDESGDAAIFGDVVSHMDNRYRTLGTPEQRILQVSCGAFLGSLDIIAFRASAFRHYLFYSPPSPSEESNDRLKLTLGVISKSGAKWPRTTIVVGSLDIAGRKTTDHLVNGLSAAGIPSRVFLAEGVGHAFEPFLDALLSVSIVTRLYRTSDLD